MSLHLVTGYAGREHVTAEDAASFNIAFVGEGETVFDRGSKFAATIIDNNHVDISDGDILMQGRHIRQIENHVTRLEFDNGERGYYRHDLIVVEYKKDSETFVESADFKVIKGTPTADESQVTDPTYTHGDITEETGAMLNQMPLYRVTFSGYDLTTVTPLFTYSYAHDHLIEDMWDSVEQVVENAENYYETEEARYTGIIDQAALDIAGDISDFNDEMNERVDRADDILVEMQEHYSYMEEYTFLASGWNNGEYSLESRYPSTDYDILAITSSNANTTEAMLEAWQSAMIYGYEPTNKVVAHEDAPTIDIVMALLVLNKSDSMSNSMNNGGNE